MPTSVAVCQVPDSREDTKTALQWIHQFSGEATGRDVSLIAFPECFLQGYLTDAVQAGKHALNLHDNAFTAMVQPLAMYSPVIVFGLIEKEDGRLFNTAVVVKNGVLMGKYRKRHLLSGEKLFTPGDDHPVFTINDFRFGINICYDTQFPEAAAAIAKQGASLLLCVSNTMMSQKKADHYKDWHVPMRAERAKENNIWLLSADVTGRREDRIAYGSASAIDPTGIITAQMPFLETGMLVVDIP